MGGIWIRTQDRKFLIYCSSFNMIMLPGYRYCISGNPHTLGVYSSEEKVMKVLNIITYLVKKNESGTIVYYMPKDEDVVLEKDAEEYLDDALTYAK